jgi:hypothetical protein
MSLPEALCPFPDVPDQFAGGLACAIHDEETVDGSLPLLVTDVISGSNQTLCISTALVP